MNKAFYFGLSILEISKIVIYEFWYNHIKRKYGKKAKLCFIETNSFRVNMRTEDFYIVIREDVEIRFNLQFLN